MICIKYTIFVVICQKHIFIDKTNLYMLIIKVKNKNIEAALKNYKYKVYKTKQLQNLNKNKEYTKDSVEKREKMKKAIYVNKKKNDL